MHVNGLRLKKNRIRLDIRKGSVKSCRRNQKPMWPVITLTLLLQLTDDEQLYAQVEQPTVQQEQKTEQIQPAVPAVASPAAAWPDEDQSNG